MVQWVRIYLPVQRTQVQYLVGELRSSMLWSTGEPTHYHAAVKSPRAATKTQHGPETRQAGIVYYRVAVC